MAIYTEMATLPVPEGHSCESKEAPQQSCESKLHAAVLKVLQKL